MSNIKYPVRELKSETYKGYVMRFAKYDMGNVLYSGAFLVKDNPNWTINNLDDVNKFFKKAILSGDSFSKSGSLEDMKQKIDNNLFLKSNPLTKENSIERVNKIIDEIRNEISGYKNLANGFSKKYNKNINTYNAFVPTYGGEEPDMFRNKLYNLGFYDTYARAYYDWGVKHSKTGISITYTEGDVVLTIPRGK